MVGGIRGAVVRGERWQLKLRGDGSLHDLLGERGVEVQVIVDEPPGLSGLEDIIQVIGLPL